MMASCISCGTKSSLIQGNPSALGSQLPGRLSATDKASFAYKTIKDRLPVIVVKTIDFLHRQRKELHKFGGTIANPDDSELATIEADAKFFVTELTKIRKEIETNKSAQLLEKLTLEPELEYFNDDIDSWNEALEAARLDDKTLPQWFDSAWLLMECYLYRRIKEAALKTKHLKMFDPFIEQKQLACKSSNDQMEALASRIKNVHEAVSQSSSQTHPSERSEFSLFIQLALWANKCDLSINLMSADKVEQTKQINLKESIESLSENILCDNISELWFKVQSIKDQSRSAASANSDDCQFIDIVADNSGYELFVDLCLAHFLGLMLCGSEPNKNVKFRFHLKRMPWFVSDALREDFKWLIDSLVDQNQDQAMRDLGNKWLSYFDSGFWQLHDHKFWTLPYDYHEMKTVSSDLYTTLSESSLIIFKGDLNYRKLTGDRKWHILTPFRVALRDFGPAPLVTLRTAKADVVVGIEDINLYAKINNNELPRDWMLSGDFGLIQFLDRV